jgi:arsenite transporter
MSIDMESAVPRLGTRDRLLPLWILAAMAVGLALGTLAPGLDDLLAGATVAGSRCRSRSGCS